MPTPKPGPLVAIFNTMDEIMEVVRLALEREEFQT